MIINTHSHIYDEAFDADREEVFQRALDVGVTMLLLPNTDESTIKPMMDFYVQHPDNVRVMMGLHPEEVKEDYKKKLKIIEEEISPLATLGRNDRYNNVGRNDGNNVGRNDRYSNVGRNDRYNNVGRNDGPLVGIGEIGLDFYWDDTFKKEQIEVFTEQLRWAKSQFLPVSIHTRNAFKEMFRVLEREQDGRLAGVMHCFNGTYEEARTAISYGFALGLGGVITYKNCGVKDFLEHIPMENIVLETDDPYLPPVPYRGKRNEPAYIVKTAEKVAEIYGVTTEDICKTTTENAIKLFKLAS